MILMNAEQQSGNADELERLQARLEELEQQLLLAQKMGALGELASSVAHEFNNILTTIINYAKMGLRHQDDATREKAFNKILSAGQRAAKITTGMLSYARSGGNRKEPHDLARLVRDVLVLVEKDLQVHRIHCDLELEGHPHASLNAGQIQQVLLNLIVNARQAMQPGNPMTVSVRENTQEGWAEVSVKDTGSGIPADVLPHIFDRFYTTKSADQRGQGGTGLGLAMCKEVVEAHDGRIRVETAIGHGTRFTLMFPLVPAPRMSVGNGHQHPIPA
jgi:signal transduction histidine kinase